MNTYKRTDRVAENILRKLAEIIQYDLTDPRVTGFITLSAVQVSNDLKHARVYFTVLKDDPKQTAAVLNSAAGYLRSLLAKKIKLRVVPQLTFVFDESVEYGARLSRLIEDANPSDDSNGSET